MGRRFPAARPDFTPGSPLVRGAGSFYDDQITRDDGPLVSTAKKEPAMSIDKSLRRKNQLARARNVLTRGERIKTLQDEERWQEGRSPYNLPKVRVLKIAKKPKKAKEEEKPAEEGAEAAAAGPAAEK